MSPVISRGSLPTAFGARRIDLRAKARGPRRIQIDIMSASGSFACSVPELVGRSNAPWPIQSLAHNSGGAQGQSGEPRNPARVNHHNPRYSQGAPRAGSVGGALVSAGESAEVFDEFGMLGGVVEVEVDVEHSEVEREHLWCVGSDVDGAAVVVNRLDVDGWG